MGRKKRQQADHRADLRGGRFIGLPEVVHKSEAFRSLSVFERSVFFEILATFNGYNNGRIVISQRQIAEALGNSNYRKISRAIAVLMERGLISISEESIWQERRAREYRLTFISTGIPPHSRPATNEYQHWSKKKAADGVAAEPGESAAALSAAAHEAADDASASVTRKAQNCVNQVNLAC